MDTIAAVAAKKLGKLLAKDFREIFGSAYNAEAERLGALARITIECIGRSDALYHTFEHTMLVTIVGRDILRGRMLSNRVEPLDYSHLIIACLLHDIGFVRGVLSGDTKTEFVIDKSGKTITLPRGASDASLAPHHVDRSKLFVYERLGNSQTIDAARVAEAIELPASLPTPTGPPKRRSLSRDWSKPPISSGSSGTPCIRERRMRSFTNLRKSAAIGSSVTNSLPTSSRNFPDFIGTPCRCTSRKGSNIWDSTASGRQWVANLHNHIFNAEHSNWQMGPQI